MKINKHFFIITLLLSSLKIMAFDGETGPGNNLRNANEIFLVQDLLKEFGQGSRAVLVGKNLENSKACYLTLSPYKEYFLSSTDKTDMAIMTVVRAYSPDTITTNELHSTKIFVNSTIPSFLGPSHTANLDREGDILTASFRYEKTKLHCAFDLKENAKLPPVPEGCKDRQVHTVLGQCKFVRNIGNSNHKVTKGDFDLKEVKIKRCIPGGTIENFAGYIPGDSRVYSTGPSTGLPVTWFSANLEIFGRRTNSERKFTQKLRYSGGWNDKKDYSYDKETQKFQYYFSSMVGLFDRRSAAAEFECNLSAETSPSEEVPFPI